MVIQFGRSAPPPRHPHDRGYTVSSGTLSSTAGSVITLIVCAIFVAVGAWMLISDHNARTSGEYIEVTGTITQIDHRWDYVDEREEYICYVTYTTLEGETLEGRYPASSSTYYIGKEVKVLYNINDPSSIRAGDTTFTIIGIVCVALGGILMILIIVSLIKGKSTNSGKKEDDTFMSDNIGPKEATKEDKVF